MNDTVSLDKTPEPDRNPFSGASDPLDATPLGPAPVGAPPLDASPVDREPLRARIGTIVWGCILLVVAAIAIIAAQADLSDATPAAVVWGVIALGGALVVAAIVVAIVRAARNPSAAR
jgi:hypothetical protein